MLKPNGSISVFDSLTRLLSYITACLRFGIYTSTSKVKTVLCCLSLSRWLWRRCWESPLQETAVWPATPDQDWSPILQGEKETKRLLRPHLHIWPLTYQRDVHSHSFLIISSSRGCLVCKCVCVCVCVCVCYLCTISELISVGFLIYKASFQPVLGREEGGTSFDSPSDM